MSEVTRADFGFFHALRVRWAEVDRQDVVFNPNYFLYFDVAVGEYWRAIGFRYPDELRPTDGPATDVFAVDARARFLAPARYDDELDVGCRVSVLGRSSKTCELAVFRGETLLTLGTLVYVHTDLETRKSAPWPASVRAKILAFEPRPPASPA